MYRLNIVLLLICLSSCHPYQKLQGVYYTANQDCVILDGKKNSLLESRENGIDDLSLLKQTRHKLKFIDARHTLLFFRKARSKYIFRILERKADSFMIAPISTDARNFFKNKPYLIFTTKYHFADQTNYFTRLQFHTSQCFGCCHDLRLTLDYSGNLKVTDLGGGSRCGRDSVLNDNYLGKLSYEDMEALRTILKYSRLKTLDWPKDRHCWDAPDLTLTVHQYDTTYSFHINEGCVPVVSWELKGFLGKLFQHPSLHKVDTTWTYEPEYDRGVLLTP